MLQLSSESFGLYIQILKEMTHYQIKLQINVTPYAEVCKKWASFISNILISNLCKGARISIISDIFRWFQPSLQQSGIL